MRRILWLLGFMISGTTILCAALPVEEAVYQEFQELKRLQQKDPQAYRKLIDDKKKSVKGYAQKMKDQGGDSYPRFIQTESQIRRKNLESIKRQHPEAFQKWADSRMKQLEKIKQNNPEKFRQLAKTHQGLNQKYSEFQRRKNLGGGKSASLHSLRKESRESSSNADSGIVRSDRSEKSSLSRPEGVRAGTNRQAVKENRRNASQESTYLNTKKTLQRNTEIKKQSQEIKRLSFPEKKSKVRREGILSRPEQSQSGYGAQQVQRPGRAVSSSRETVKKDRR